MFSVIASLALLSVPALALDHTQVDGVVGIKINRISQPSREASPDANHGKRAASHAYMDSLANQRYYYLTQVKIGSPAQNLDLLIDTGSSDTWVVSKQTQSGGGSNVQTTLFDSTQSKTWKSNNTNWNIQYGKGSASGSWGTDTLSIGGASVKGLSIGVANQVQQINEGIAGIGRPQAEITFSSAGYQYDNLPLKMMRNGLIGAAAYSMSLDDINSPDGVLLFGGVDHDQYEGQLVQLPITHPKHMGVNIRGIKGDQRDTSQLLSSPTIAVLDSGTSLTYVDSKTLGSIREAFNSNPSFALGERYYSDCNITDNLWFDFGDTSIPVPAYNFMWPISQFVDPVTAALEFPENSCYIGIEESSSDENFILMGDNVLRSMYIVYDISNSRIALARTKASSGQPQVEAIVAGSAIPGVINAET